MTYTVTVQLGDWTATVIQGVEQADAAIVVDHLTATWQSDPALFPSQPEPVVCSFSLFVPDLATSDLDELDGVLDGGDAPTVYEAESVSGGAPVPEVYQGQPVKVVLTGPGYDPSAPGAVPVFEFAGRVADVEAEPRHDGMLFDVNAVDFTADLAEERIGDVPWPLERWNLRWIKVAQASSLDVDTTGDAGGYAPLIQARDVDSQPTADVMEDLLSDSAIWWDAYTSVIVPPGKWFYELGYRRGPLQRWTRPVVVQDVTAFPDPVFRLDYVGQGVTDDAALPYRLVDVAGELELQRKAAPNMATSPVVVVPASAVDRRVRWRQDKDRHTNRVRLTGSIVSYDPVVGADVTLTDFVRQHDAAVRDRGPVEASKPTTVQAVVQAMAVALMYLGDVYDTVPRWAFDEVTIRLHGLDDDAAWPRMFPSLEGETALGRFFLLTDIPSKWNLYARPDFPGRLVSARLELRGERVTLTAGVLHEIPTPNGPDPGGLTWDDLTDPTVADPTWNDVDELIWADMRLTDHPVGA